MIETRRVIVSPHAVERLLERHPEIVTRDATAHIFFEVQAAFRAGRTAKRIPRWIAPLNRRRPPKGDKRNVRYVWDVNERRCYVLAWGPSPDGQRSWIVTTTLAAPLEVAA